MLRILKFVGAFLGTFIVIFFIVFGFNMDALMTLMENSEDIQEGSEWVEKTYSLKGLTEYIGEQPRHVSIVSLAIENPDSSIRYNDDTPRTMGRLSNVILLAEYVRQVEKGAIDPNKQIKLNEVSKLQLPFVDASNHEDALQALRNQGKVSEQNTVPVDAIMSVSLEYNDLAASDFMFHYLNRKDRSLDETMNVLGLQQTDLPLPFSGLYIIAKPSLYGDDFRPRLDSLQSLSKPDFRKLVISSSRKMANNPSYREKVKQAFNEDEGLGVGFKELRDALHLFPKTTANDMAVLMKSLLQDQLISADVSQRMKKFLDWPMQTGRLQKDFDIYGAIYDSRMGLVNGIDYGRSSYSGKPFAQAVFFDDLQIALWLHMSSNLIHQDFQQRLIWDPALREATVNQIKQ